MSNCTYWNDGICNTTKEKCSCRCTTDSAYDDLKEKLERAINLIKRNQAAWDTSMDKQNGILPVVYMSNFHYCMAVDMNKIKYCSNESEVE